MDSLFLFRNGPGAHHGVSLGAGGSGRSSSASSVERSVLLGALATHMGVLDARENDAQTIIRKSELWDEITRQFNAQTATPRSRQQIQTLYKNMKAKARRYESRLAEVSSGVPPPDPDPISEILLGLLHQQMQHQRRHLQQHLTSLDSHALAMPQEEEEEAAAKGSFRHFSSPGLLTPDQVMQVSLEEGVAPEFEVKGEPRDSDGDSPCPQAHDSGPDVFSDPPVALPAPRPPKPEDVTEKQTALGSDFNQPEEQEGQRRIEEHTQLQLQQHQHHHHPLAAALIPSFANNCKLPYPMAATTANSTSLQQQLGNNSGSPQVTPGPPSLLAQTLAPSDPDTHHQDFHPAIKRLKLDNLPEAPRIGGGGNVGGEGNIEGGGNVGGVGGNIGVGGNVLVPLRLPTNASSSLSCSVSCSCPDLHASLLALSRHEHHLREKMMQEEMKMKVEEHAARMRILTLKENMWRARVKEEEEEVKFGEGDGEGDGAGHDTCIHGGDGACHDNNGGGRNGADDAKGDDDDDDADNEDNKALDGVGEGNGLVVSVNEAVVESA